MDEQSRMQEIQKLRSAIAAGSHDFRNVYGRLAKLLAEAGKRREAASVVLEAADRLFTGKDRTERERDLLKAKVFVGYAQICAPNDPFVEHRCRQRIAVIEAAVAAERARIQASRPRRPHLILVPSPSS